MVRIGLVVILLIGKTRNTTTYNYINQGNDWTGNCSSGSEQSPINIRTQTVQQNQNHYIYLRFNTNTKTVKLENKGLTVQVDGEFMKIVSYGLSKGQSPRTFVATHFDFHSKSEHTIDNKYADLEMHVICRESSDSQSNNGSDKRIYASFVFMFQKLQQTSEWFKMIDFSKIGTNISVNGYNGLYQMINRKAMELQQNNTNGKLGYYHYEGSYTSPGCDEVVHYYVIDQLFEISESQLNQFTSLYSGNVNWGQGNYRAVKGLGNRQITKGEIKLIKQIELARTIDSVMIRLGCLLMLGLLSLLL